MRTKITNPLLAEALVMNEFKAAQNIDDSKSPQIGISKSFIRKQENKNSRGKNFGGALEEESSETIVQIEESIEKAKWRRYYIQYALHMIIPIYGTFVLVMTIIITYGTIQTMLD